MKAWIAALACAAFVAGAAVDPKSMNAPEIIETLGAPVVIESASVDFQQIPSSGTDRQQVTPVVTVQALSNVREPVDTFTIRLDHLGPDGQAKGLYTRVLGSEFWGADGARFTVALEGWLIKTDERLRIAVTAARVGERLWSDGVWTEVVGEIPTGSPCAPDFCANASDQCGQTCGIIWGISCVKSFTCRVGFKLCESACTCKSNPLCGLRPDEAG